MSLNPINISNSNNIQNNSHQTINNKYTILKYTVAGITAIALGILFAPITLGLSLVAGTCVSYCLYKDYKKTQQLQDPITQTSQNIILDQSPVNPPSLTRVLQTVSGFCFYQEINQYILVISARGTESEQFIEKEGKEVSTMFFTEFLYGKNKKFTPTSLILGNAIGKRKTDSYKNVQIFACIIDKQNQTIESTSHLNNTPRFFKHSDKFYNNVNQWKNAKDIAQYIEIVSQNLQNTSTSYPEKNVKESDI